MRYISQAILLTGNQPLGFDSYIFNPDYHILGPTMYPNGFPLLLSIPYSLEGNSIEAFLTLVAVFYFIYSFLVLLILRKDFGKLSALLITLLIIFNPVFTAFKDKILSDVPFSVFFMAAIYLISHKNLDYKKVIFAAILAAYAIFTRSMGWSLVGGALIFLVFNFRSLGDQKKKYVLFIVGSTLLFFTLSLLFPTSSKNTYAALYQSDNILLDLRENLENYSLLLRDLFPVYYPGSEIVQVLIGSGLLVFFAVGFLKRFFGKPGIIWWVIILYIISALFYPASLYQRFFFPIIPFVFLYARSGAQMLIKENPGVLRYGTYALLLIAIYFNAQHTARLKENHTVPPGPHQQESQEAFDFLEENVGENETVNFIKPRVLAFYTGLRSFSNHPQQNLENMRANFEKYNIKWLLTSENEPNPALEAYIEQCQPDLQYQNSRMRIYKVAD